MEGSIAADDADDVSIPEAGWEKLGKTTAKYFKSLVPAIHPLYVFVFRKLAYT